MYNTNEYMYAIERSDDYLAHYGIRGMKWGVRKAREMGGARGQKALSRQYAKAQKKLAKLESRAAKADKYKKRAVRYGVGAAAVGGLAAAGTRGVGNAINAVGKYGSKAMRGVGYGMSKVGLDISKAGRYAHSKGLSKAGLAISKAGMGMKNSAKGTNLAVMNVGEGLKRWGNSTSIGKGIQNTAGKYAGRLGAGKGAMFNTVARDNARKATAGIAKINNNAIARIGAGAVAAGLGAASAKNAYRAATAQKKAQKFRSEMNKAFRGTQYASNNSGASSTSKPRQGKKRRR